MKEKNRTLIYWDEAAFSVGLRKMDRQHEQLVGLINALYAQKDSGDHEFIDRVFATLVLYTKQHFVDEEKILKKLHYPALELHHRHHLSFIRTLNAFKTDYDRHKGGKEILEKLNKFLADWWTHHILVEDRAYTNYLEG